MKPSELEKECCKRIIQHNCIWKQVATNDSLKQEEEPATFYGERRDKHLYCQTPCENYYPFEGGIRDET